MDPPHQHDHPEGAYFDGRWYTAEELNAFSPLPEDPYDPNAPGGSQSQNAGQSQSQYHDADYLHAHYSSHESYWAQTPNFYSPYTGYQESPSHAGPYYPPQTQYQIQTQSSQPLGHGQGYADPAYSTGPPRSDYGSYPTPVTRSDPYSYPYLYDLANQPAVANSPNPYASPSPASRSSYAGPGSQAQQSLPFMNTFLSADGSVSSPTDSRSTRQYPRERSRRSEQERDRENRAEMRRLRAQSPTAQSPTAQSSTSQSRANDLRRQRDQQNRALLRDSRSLSNPRMTAAERERHGREQYQSSQPPLERRRAARPRCATCGKTRWGCECSARR